MDEHEVLFSGTENGRRRPLLILAFDEAHGLTDVSETQGWSLYSELHRSLSEFVDLPIFTLFLSTAGKFHLFSPPRSSDSSSRIILGANRVLPPITETGFDQFALDAKEGDITLDRVVEDEWICRLGRPLYVFLALEFSLGGGLRSDYRVGSLLVISLKKITINVRSCSLRSRSCSVAPTISLTILSRQITLTGLLHAYPSASHSSSTSHDQMHAI